MDWITLLSGWALLLAVAIDFGYTAISAAGVGTLTRFVARSTFRTMKFVSADRPAPMLQLLAGPACMVAIASTWIIGIASGWTLIFVSGTEAVLMNGEPASFWQRVSLVISSLSTAGSSNASPGSAAWDIGAGVAAVSGMIVLTLSVSFVLNVMQTVTNGRAFATLVHSLDPADPKNRVGFTQTLSTLVSSLNAAPVALYYTAADPSHRVADAFLHLVWKLKDDRSNFDAYLPALTRLPYAGVEPGDSYATAALKIEDWTVRLNLGAKESEELPDGVPQPAFSHITVRG